MSRIKNIITTVILSITSMMANAQEFKINEYATEILIPSIKNELSKSKLEDQLNILFIYKNDIEKSYKEQTGNSLEELNIDNKETASISILSRKECIVSINDDFKDSYIDHIYSNDEFIAKLTFTIWHEIGHCYDSHTSKDSGLSETTKNRREIAADTFAYGMTKQLKINLQSEITSLIRDGREHAALQASNFTHYTNILKYRDSKELAESLGNYSDPYTTFIVVNSYIKSTGLTDQDILIVWKGMIDYKIAKKLEMSEWDKMLNEKLADAPKYEFKPEFQ